MWAVIYIIIELVFFCLLMISYFCRRPSRVYKVCSILVNVNLKNLICVLMLLSQCALDLVKGLTLHVLNLPLFMVTHSSGSVNVVILVFISQVVDLSGAPMTVLNQDSLELSMPSIVKSDELHLKKRLLLCFVQNVCRYYCMRQKLALCSCVIKDPLNSPLREYS